VPPYLESITVLMETEIFNITLQKTEKFSESKTFAVTCHKSNTNMSEIYLRKEKSDYYVYIFGKNGEPKSNIPVSVSMQHTKFAQMRADSNLVTDKEGKIKLGHLKNIVSLDANVGSLGIHGDWVINSSKQQMTYPSTIDTIENETIEFPVVFNKISRKQIAFLKIN
jgi:hypothetical protein